MATTVQTHPLISIRSSASVREAARLMADCSIGALGVLDKDRRFAGIVTERDLSWFVAQGKDAAGTTVEDITNVSADAHLEDIARLMRLHQVNRIPVVDDDRLIGVVTRGDVLGAIGHVEHQAIDLTSPPVLVGSAGLNPGRGMYV
jgi:CBS domain-containing protein